MNAPLITHNQTRSTAASSGQIDGLPTTAATPSTPQISCASAATPSRSLGTPRTLRSRTNDSLPFGSKVPRPPITEQLVGRVGFRYNFHGANNEHVLDGGQGLRDWKMQSLRIACRSAKKRDKMPSMMEWLDVRRYIVEPAEDW
jgi:hypothetical protein